MELTPAHPYTLRVLGFEDFGLESSAFETALLDVLGKANLKNVGVYQFKLLKKHSSFAGRIFQFRQNADECLYWFRCYVGGVFGIPTTHYGILQIPPLDAVFRVGILADLVKAAAEVLSQLPACESSSESTAKTPAPEEQPPAPQRADANNTDSSPVADPPPQPVPMKEKRVKRPPKKTVAAAKQRAKKRKPTLEEMLKQARTIETAFAKQLEEAQGMIASIETLIKNRDKFIH